MLRSGFVFAAACLLLAGCSKPVPLPPSSIKRTAAPVFQIKDLQGNPFSSDQLRGKIVVINFWAAWCPPCVREVRDLSDLSAEFRSKGVEILGIGLDEEGAPVIRPFVEREAPGYPILVASTDFTNQFGGIDAIPSTFIIDRDWHLVNRFTGNVSGETLRAEIEALLNPKQPERKESAPQ
jgi:peroxiredoxin